MRNDMMDNFNMQLTSDLLSCQEQYANIET